MSVGDPFSVDAVLWEWEPMGCRVQNIGLSWEPAEVGLVGSCSDYACGQGRRTVSDGLAMTALPGRYFCLNRSGWSGEVTYTVMSCALGSLTVVRHGLPPVRLQGLCANLDTIPFHASVVSSSLYGSCSDGLFRARRSRPTSSSTASVRRRCRLRRWRCSRWLRAA